MTQPELTQEFLLRLRSFVARRSPPGVDPQDIVQDVVTRLWSQPQRPQGKRLHGWLFTAARNAVIDAYRRRRPQHDLEEAQQLSEVLESPSALEELGQCLQPLLTPLQDSDRELLLSVDGKCLSQADLARQLQVPASTIKARVLRARARLRAQVEACCWLMHDAQGRLLDFHPRPGSPCGSCRST